MDPTSPFGDPDNQATPTNQNQHLPTSVSSAVESPFRDDPSSLRPDPLSASAAARAKSPSGYDEPPASIMLDIDGVRPHADKSPTRTASSGSKRSKPSIFEQSRIAEDVVPSASGRSSSRRDGRRHQRHDAYADEDEDPESLYSDEEAALMARQERSRGYPNASRSSSRRKGKSSANHDDDEDIASAFSERSASNSSRRQRKSKSWGWSSSLPSTSPRSRRMALGGLDAKQKALWMWANVDNVDAFLQEVYAYYVGKGAYCIALTRALNLLTIAFVISFSTFLLGCVDYSKIKHDGSLSEVIVDHCVSRFSNLTILSFVVLIAFYSLQVVQFGFGLSRLVAMHRFYTHLLNVPDVDVQSIPWNEIVNRLAALREEHPITSLSSNEASDGIHAAKDKLDAHDVANRIMRQENYLIALFNKDILDLSVPGLKSSPTLTRSLEWNLNFALLGFLFDSRGQVRRQFLAEKHRSELIEGLRRRFMFMALVNALFAPFIVLYLLLYSFFRYFEEYHKDPSNLGSRQYTQYARWKFREYNELPHLFRRRCHSSYPYAQRYIDQFPKEKTAIAARFVAFVAGSFTAVLLLASVIDPDLFLHFDITHQRNVLFYIGVFGTVLAVSRGMIPDDHLVPEPDLLLRAVIHHTHYMPPHWKNRFHSTEVLVEFGTLYMLKIYIFFQELLSVITTPFVLWLSLPKCAPEIIDFFREFTVHVDGVGHVCSFAVFDFKREGAKMEQSILGFKANHPEWEPADPVSSVLLAKMAAQAEKERGFTPVNSTMIPPRTSRALHKSTRLGGVVEEEAEGVSLDEPGVKDLISHIYTKRW